MVIPALCTRPDAIPTPLPVTVLLMNTLPLAAAAVRTTAWLEVPVTRLPVNVFMGEALMSRPSPLVVSMPLSRISLPVIVQPVAPAARRTPATRPNPIRLDRTVPFLPPPEYTPP